jgi:K+-transporting ATPase KdpF subunit
MLLDCFSPDSLPNIPCPSLSQRIPVVFDLYLGGLVALGLAIYLGYALFHPEKF